MSNKNQRKIYFINPRFQLRFSIYVCILVTLCTSAYVNIIFNLLGDMSMTLGKTKEWHAVKDNVVWSLGLWQLGMFGLIFCLCIYFSHKIAGPIYKLGKFLVKVREEGVVTKLAFRKADYFEELAEEYNKTMEYISTKQREDFTYLSEVTTYLSNLAVGLPDDKKMVVHEISKNLTEIQERYLNS